MSSKTVNLTIRLPEKLKVDAEQAALSLDVSLSQVVRRALKALVEESSYHTSARSKIKSEVQALDRRIGESLPCPPTNNNKVEQGVNIKTFQPIQKASSGRKARLAQLEALEARNMLNRETRRELDQLRKNTLPRG